MVLEYHSPDRIEYEKETIPYMQELSRVDLKMLSETQKIVSEQKYRYGKDEHKKGRNQRTANRFVWPIGLLGPIWDQTVCVCRSLMKAKELRAEIDENNKEVEKDLQADVYKGRVWTSHCEDH